MKYVIGIEEEISFFLTSNYLSEFCLITKQGILKKYKIDHENEDLLFIKEYAGIIHYFSYLIAYYIYI